MAKNLSEEDLAEIKALVVGFLQQKLKEQSAFTIAEFDRRFPTDCDEEPDWYKRFGKRNSLECLQAIPDTVNIKNRNGQPYISLNLASSAVDRHLVDLITNQKTTSRKRPSARARSSFSLNKRFDQQRSFGSSNYANSNQRQRVSVSKSQSWNQNDLFKSAPQAPNRKVATPSFQSNNLSNISASQQSNNNGWSSSQVPTKTSRVTSQQAAKRPATQEAIATVKSTTKPDTSKVASKQTANQDLVLRTQAKEIKENKQPPIDRDLQIKKDHLRQRIERLLSKEVHNEIKLISLTGLYEREFDEKLDCQQYGHQGIVSLLEDPVLSKHFIVDFSQSPFVIIKARFIGRKETKEDDSKHAIELFNLKGMKQCLENYILTPADLEPIKKKPVLPIEDIVKYKTLRLIFKSPGNQMSMNDWSEQFEKETKLHLSIDVYGYNSYDEFFVALLEGLPLIITHDDYGDIVAEVDNALLKDWIKSEIGKGNYRCVMSLSREFDRVAFPGDEFNYFKKVDDSTYYPVSILTVKKENEMWLMSRNSKAFTELLAVQTTMYSYNDYRKLDMTVKLPKRFIVPGCPCAVYDEDNHMWSRGCVIERISDSKVCVLEVDYGRERTFKSSSLWCLMRSHLDIPVVPFCCSFEGLDLHEKVPPQFKVILQEYSNANVVLACKFLRQNVIADSSIHMPKSRWIVDLCDTRNGEIYLSKFICNSVDMAQVA